MVLTRGRAVVVFAAALLPGHAHSVLQQRVTRTTTGLTAPGGVQAHGVTMEIGAGARAGLPAGPFFLTSAALCSRHGYKIREGSEKFYS